MSLILLCLSFKRGVKIAVGLFSRNQRCRLWPKPGPVLEGACNPGSCDSYLVTQGVEGSTHECVLIMWLLL